MCSKPDKSKIAKALWELRNVLYENDIELVSETGSFIEIYVDGEQAGCSFTVVNSDALDECREDL